MIIPNPGPVGDAVARIEEGFGVVHTRSNHGLVDGERVRISTEAGPVLCYAKASGHSPDVFRAYSDEKLGRPLPLTKSGSGGSVVRLAAKDWAIIAGINFYPAFAELHGAVYDATMFARWLRDTACVPDDQMTLIQSPPSPPGSIESAQPTLDMVTGAFARLARTASRKPFYHLGHRLYIYLSGHGILPTRNSVTDFDETALLMANADSINLGWHVGGHAFAEWFRALGVFNEVVLLVDCCRDQKDEIGLTSPPMSGLRPMRDPAKRFYAAAAQLDSKSWEQPFGDPPVSRGIFSFALMEGLESQSLCDANGQLTASVLAKHLEKRVPELKDGQSPDINYKPGDEEIVFVKRANPSVPTVSISFGSRFHGLTVELSGRKYPQPEASHTIDQEPWAVRLPPSTLHRMLIRETNERLLLEVDGTEVQHARYE